MRIAVVGTGISGLLTARLLHGEHDVTVFEAGDYAGGHTNTVRVASGSGSHDIDTGFIVYNERTYPNFVRLLALLGVRTQPTTMSFSVRCDASGFEYGTASARALIAQPRNLLQPAFYRMFRDVLRFHRHAPALLESTNTELSLGDWLTAGGYSPEFLERYVVPMGAAIWSTEPARLLEFPASTFVRFFHNHGLLSLRDQPCWRVVRGGSARYVERLVGPMRDRIRLRTPVRRVRRTPRAVQIETSGSAPETFDRIVIATHSDQALRMLADPSPAEREVLGAITYQPNEAVLHTDVRVLPKRRDAWSAWNYRITGNPGPVAVTYNMNLLQGIHAHETFCVTLNDDGSVDPARVLQRIAYSHPLFTSAAIAAQARRAEISGVNRTHYAGAYWANGFHEDGVNSALAVARNYGVGLERLVTRLDICRSGDSREGDRLAS